jgi:hypothetical protein
MANMCLQDDAEQHEGEKVAQGLRVLVLMKRMAPAAIVSAGTISHQAGRGSRVGGQNQYPKCWWKGNLRTSANQKPTVASRAIANPVVHARRNGIFVSGGTWFIFLGLITETGALLRGGYRKSSPGVHLLYVIVPSDLEECLSQT